MFTSANNPTMDYLQDSEILMEKDYLNDNSCRRIQSLMRNNYFSRLDRASLKHFQPKLVPENNQSESLPSIHKRHPIMTKQYKQILFSNKIRQENFEKEKKKPKKKKQKMETEINDNLFICNNEMDYRKELEDNLAKGVRKAKLPKIERKQLVDYNALKYDTRYIDSIENRFICPYLNKNKYSVYTDFIENKKSKIPLNFIIS